MLPRTVKFREPNRFLCRRVFGVDKAEMVVMFGDCHMWRLTNRRGEMSFIPVSSVIHFGRKVERAG